MKKSVCLCLCLTLLLALASCGPASQPGPTPSPDPTASPSPGPAAPPPSPSPSLSPSPTPSPTPPAPSPSPAYEGGGAQPGEQNAGESSPEIGDVVVPDLSGERNQALVSALTPINAEVISDTEETVNMKSKQSMDELIAFYETALGEIGATQAALHHSTEDYWVYSGVYDTEYLLIIELRNDGGLVNITIIY